MHTKLIVVGYLWRQRDGNETRVRVKVDPPLVFKIRNKYCIISDLGTGPNLGDVNKKTGFLDATPSLFSHK